MNDRGSDKSGIQKLESISWSDAYPLPTMKPFEPRRSLHSLLRVQTRWLTTLKHKTLYIDTFRAATQLKNADYKVDISRLQSRREGPPRFQKLSPELCAVLFPAAIPTTAGLASKKSPAPLHHSWSSANWSLPFLLDRRQKQLMNWLELGARRKATPSKVDYEAFSIFDSSGTERLSKKETGRV